MARSADMMLLRNGPAGGHKEAIAELMDGATSISIAVAFLKTSGLQAIIEGLRERLCDGACVEVFVGTDFFHTDPEALRTLLDLSRTDPSLSIQLAKADPRSTFHPKLYLGVGDRQARVVVGSANLTGGGLGGNEEVSVRCLLGLDDPLLTHLRNVFDDYRAGERCEELDAVLLGRYRRAHKIAQDAKRRVDKEIAATTAADASDFDLGALGSLFAEFSADPDQVAALARRARNLKRARAVQRRIADMTEGGRLRKAEIATFTDLFRDLVTSGDGHRHLWHSGDIHRRGQAAISQPEETIALFELGRKASRLDPADGYALMREPAGKIAGVGINMVSEILCTFSPRRYAVFNGNTAQALRHIGADPPRTVGLFAPRSYARVCETVEAVRRRIGASDLSETDAFLNWIYYNKIKGAGATS